MKMKKIGYMVSTVAFALVSTVYSDLMFSDLRYTFSNSWSPLGGVDEVTASDISVTDAANMLITTSSFYTRGTVTDGDTLISGTPNYFEPTDYLTWDLTVDSGYELDLNEIKFEYWADDDSQYGVSYALRSSLDNFSSDIGVVENYESKTKQWLVSSLGSDFDHITGSIAFRIYVYGDERFNGGTERARVDNLYLSGGVVPEPATMSAVLMGLAGLFVIRRVHR